MMNALDANPVLAGPAGPFGVFFVVVLVLVLTGFVVVIVGIIRNSRRIRQSGHDPLTLQSDLAVRALNSDLLSPRRSTEERLAELQRLHRDGTITAEELAAARARILGGDPGR
ncbi:hypothetical protein [Arthrobacter sp. RIT-PI-e]|uniref:hypothetical protein n=1 Tax=Arthrobacter sp. RIT-PI-e TaxID=1681197 RepID=UPI000676574A|nr:hypothetical protein [Arthrobacter sp. RIT-PI-e]